MSAFLIVGMGMAANAKVPSFDDNFANYMTDATPDQYGRVETVFKICVDRNLTLMENIKNLFYPNITNKTSECAQNNGGQLRNIIRILTFGLIFLMIIITGVGFVMNAGDAKAASKAGMNIVYIGYGAFLVLGSIWILGYVINIGDVQGSSDLVNRIQNNLFLQILSFFKVLAFFFAIIMMVVNGFKMMAAMDKADKAKAGIKGVVNIIVALVCIKLIDYLFYIAQMPDFAQKAGDLVLTAAKLLGRGIGLCFVFALFYAGYMMFVAGGDDKAMKKTKGILVNIFLVSVVIFFFLLIIYQIFNEFVN